MLLKPLLLAQCLFAFVSGAEQQAELVVPINKKVGPLKLANGTVSFDALFSHLDYVKTKYARAKLPANSGTDSEKRLIAKRQTTVIPLTPEETDEWWSAAVTVGTPGAPLLFDFDTGSADTIAAHSDYDPAKSSTSRDTGLKFEMSYGGGQTASGPIFTDVFQLGNLKVKNATIGRSSDNQLQGQVIAGLGPIEGAEFATASPLWKTLLTAGQLAQPFFTFKLGKGPVGSQLTFGASAPDAFYVDTIQSHPWNFYWAVPSKVIDVEFKAIIDSGTSFLVADPAFALKVFKRLGIRHFVQEGAYFGYHNCKKPPKLTMSFGEKTVAFDPTTLDIGTTDSGDCVLGFIGEDLGLGDSVVIAGDTLFRNSVISFDLARLRVGFS